MQVERRPQVVAVEALGTAWTVHSLYPDPETQPAFRRAVETLREVVEPDMTIEVEGPHFLSEGDEVETEREGAERLARRCYVHHIESIRFEDSPGALDIAKLFGSLAKEEESVRASGGVAAALRRDGVASISVVQRSQLRTLVEEEVVDRDDRVQSVIDRGSDPKEFAAALVEEAGGDPEKLAELFFEEYQATLELVDDDDYQGREEVVKAFVETFFHLPTPASMAVFTKFLNRQESDSERAFLDQFAGNELARLAPSLDPSGLALLLDYARVSTDRVDGRPEELLELIQTTDAVQAAREVAAVSVHERLRDLAGSGVDESSFVEALQSEFPNPQHFFYHALEVFRGLLFAEDRDDRFRRLMRIWIGKVGTAVRRGQYRRAELWLRAVMDASTFADHRRPEVEEALAQISSSEIMSAVVQTATEGGEAGPAVRLLKALGTSAVNVLVDILAEEQDAARRRMLVDILSEVATDDPDPLTARLSDPRWYLVRNIVIVLRHTGDRDAIRAMRPVLSYADHRVRLEALRGLAMLGDEAVPFFETALGDDHPSIRQTAIALLGTQESDAAERLLVAALDRRSLDLAEKQRVVDLLSERSSPKTRAALEQLAAKRFSFSASTRTLRRSARDALKGSQV
jgi:hypothetical protein